MPVSKHVPKSLTGSQALSRLERALYTDISLSEIAQNIECTPLIQSPILYCVKAHMQKFFFFNLKLHGVLNSSIFLED